VKLTKAFIEDIRRLIHSARATVAHGVDLVQVYANFEIGRCIVEFEQQGKGRAAYGKEVVKALAERLTDEFGSGFSERNLAYMRTFYLLYRERSSILQTLSAKSVSGKKLQTVSAKLPQDEKGQAQTQQLPVFPLLTGEAALSTQTQLRPFNLSWSHYVFLMGIKNADERSFYEIYSSTDKAIILGTIRPATILGNCEDALNNQACSERSRRVCPEQSLKGLI
jgi:hypothetical protein